METKLCVKCQEEKPISEFGHRSDKPHLLKSWCNRCCALRSANFRGSHPETPEKREERNITQARYRNSHKEELKIAGKLYRQRNSERERSRSKQNKEKTREELFGLYGKKCVCCGEELVEFLTLDHVNGRTGKRMQYRDMRDATKNFDPTKYRVLCMNCNFSFGVRGYCPHQKEGK